MSFQQRGNTMIDTFVSWLHGDLSPRARVWTAAAPAILLLSATLCTMAVFALRNRLRGPFRDADVDSRGSTRILGLWIRHWFVWTVRPVVSVLLRTSLPPAAITTLALLFATGAAAAMAAGRMALGGWLFIAGSICDALDGRVARAARAATPAGAMLDSVTDRYVDGVIYIGLAWFYRDSWVLVAVMFALLGSLVVPYVRAKGESLGVTFPNVGLAQRPERVAVLGGCVALSPIVEALMAPGVQRPIHRLAVIGIVAVAVASHLTSIQRLVHAQRRLKPRGAVRHPWGRGRMLRNAIVSTFAALCDFALVLAMVGWYGVPPPLATFLGCVAGAAVTFAANRVWASGSRSVPAVQASRYLLLSASGAMLNAGLVAALLLQPLLPYPLVWVLVRILVFVTWDYPLFRDYVVAEQLEAPEH